jgi:hypothetical protein
MTQDADDSVILHDAVTPVNDGSSDRPDRVPALCGTRNIALNYRPLYKFGLFSPATTFCGLIRYDSGNKIDPLAI